MDYTVWVYNSTPDIKYGLSDIEMYSRSMFETVSETLSNCHVLGCMTYVLEPKFQKPGIKIPKLDPRSQIGFNMGYRKMHSTQVGLALNLLNVPISPHYNDVFDDIFSTVVSIIASDQ